MKTIFFCLIALFCINPSAHCKTAEDFVYHGAENFGKGLYREAIEDFSEAIKINPNYAGAYYNRGLSYGKLNLHTKAIEDYTSAIKIDPNFALAYYNRGTTYGELKQYTKAIEDCSSAIKIDPNFALAYYNRGASYVLLKKYMLALKDAEQAISLDPDRENSKKLHSLILEQMKKDNLKS